MQLRKDKNQEDLDGYRRHRPDLRPLVAIDPSPSTMLRERGQLLGPTARAVAAQLSVSMEICLLGNVRRHLREVNCAIVYEAIRHLCD